MTLKEWWTEWSKARVIEYATIKRDESHWNAHLEKRWGTVSLAAISALDVESWLAQMQRDGVGATTRAQCFRLLRHMLSDAARHKMVKADPTSTVKVPKIPKHVDRFLSWDEWTRLRDAAPTDRDRLMLSLMALAGLRWGEVAGLHAHRVDLERRRLTVVEVLQRDQSIKNRPKSWSGQRDVPLVAELVDGLAPLVERGGLLFPGVDYTNWRRRVFVPAREAARLPDPQPTIHDLRHSFGSWLAERGVPPHEIQALMGHSSLRATERYMHAGAARFDRMIDALAPRVIESA